MERQNRSPIKPSLFLNALHIYGLFGIAVAYPVFNFLRVNPAYLLTNGVTSEQLYLLISLLTFVIPSIFVVLELELGRWSTKLSTAVHYLLVAVLVALSFCPLVSRIDALSVWLDSILVAILTLIVLREYRTSKFTYVGLALLAPIAVALTADFMLNHNIRQLLDPDRSKPVDWQAEDNSRLSPVVMVVFDGLPLLHLLDANGDIDRKRFPNFADMADESTWYSNATTVHDLTLKSIPAMLTGIYSTTGGVLPLPENYPTTLFDTLRWDYRINAHESSTEFSGASQEQDTSRSIDGEVLLTDLMIFYIRSLLPTHAADRWLPLEKEVWGGFLARMPDAEKKTWKDVQQW